MRKTISARKDVSVLFITPGKAVWCSRFSAPLNSKKWHLKVWLAGTLCWLKDFCPYLLSAFLGQTRGSKYHHQRKQQEVRSSSSSLFTGLVGFRTKLCYFQVSFFFVTGIHSQSVTGQMWDSCSGDDFGECESEAGDVQKTGLWKFTCPSFSKALSRSCLQSFELLLFVLCVAHSAATPALYEVRLRSDQWRCSSKCCCQYV